MDAEPGGILMWQVAPEARGERLDRWLVSASEDLSRNQIQRAIDEGRLTVDGAAPGKAGQRLRGGEAIALSRPAVQVSSLTPEAIPLKVVYSDADLAVIDKAPGLVVHPGAGHATGTLVHALLHWAREQGRQLALNDSERPGIVHRIDKDTSGLLVVALSERALIGLQAMFQAHALERVYRAVTLGARAADRGTIESTHARAPNDRKRFTGRLSKGRRAVTHWEVLARGQCLSLLECRLETGRTHQIRMHLSEMGMPIVADPIYGSPVPGSAHGASSSRAGGELRAARQMPRLALHAAVLGFAHPVTGAALRFESPDPDDLRVLCESFVEA